MPQLVLSPILAQADTLSVLGAARDTIGPLSEAEIHTFIYFGRTLAAAANLSIDSDDEGGGLPYAFTVSDYGGPYAADVHAAIRWLSLNQYLEPSSGGEAVGSSLFCLTPAGATLARSSLWEVPDSNDGRDFIRAGLRAALLRPLPVVLQAMYREPSLALARRHGWSLGVPISPNIEMLSQWIKEVVSRLPQQFENLATATYLVPLVIEALQIEDYSGDGS